MRNKHPLLFKFIIMACIVLIHNCSLAMERKKAKAKGISHIEKLTDQVMEGWERIFKAIPPRDLEIKIKTSQGDEEKFFMRYEAALCALQATTALGNMRRAKTLPETQESEKKVVQAFKCMNRLLTVLQDLQAQEAVPILRPTQSSQKHSDASAEDSPERFIVATARESRWDK